MNQPTGSRKFILYEFNSIYSVGSVPSRLRDDIFVVVFVSKNLDQNKWRPEPVGMLAGAEVVTLSNRLLLLKKMLL